MQNYSFKHIEKFYDHKAITAKTVTLKYDMEDQAVRYFHASNFGVISRAIGWPSRRELRELQNNSN